MAILEKERNEVMRLEEELQKVMGEDEEEERLYNEMVKEYEEVSKQEVILKAEIEQLRREVGDDNASENKYKFILTTLHFNT